MAEPARVLLFGTGAVGTIYAAVLHNSGAKLTAVCRTNYQAARANGFTIKSPIFGNVNFKPAGVVQSVAEAVQSGLGPFDFVVICAKSLPGLRPSQAELIAPAVMKGLTGIVLTQNGINIEKEYAERFLDNPIISGVIYLPATQISPAVVTHGDDELLHIGTYPSTAPEKHKDATSQFASLMRKGGATVDVHEDVQLERWRKVTINALLNPITALSRSRDAELAQSSPWASDYMRDVMLEVTNVARAAGYDAGDEKVVEAYIQMLKTKALPGAEPSMMADALGGRAMEVEAIVGNVVRVAEENGLKVPLLKGLYVLLKALDGSKNR